MTALADHDQDISPELVVDDRDATDAAIVRAARLDLARFAPLYDRYHDPIYGYCLRRLPDRDAAGDVTSVTFARAMTSLHSFRGGSFRAWLFAIARNAVIDATRRDRRHADLDAAGHVADGAPSPETLAIAGDQRDRLAAALARLTPDQRDVVELRLAGLTGPEVAATLGLSLASVKSLQHRAYTRLRTLLADDLGSHDR